MNKYPCVPRRFDESGKRLSVPPLERLMARVSKSPDPDGCWTYIGPSQTGGYGTFHLSNKDGERTIKANKAAWILLVGPIPKGSHLCHLCDNPMCVRPSHMYLGTHATNMNDVRTRRRRLGDRCPTRKLSWDAVRVIRGLHGLTPNRTLAALYGVSQGTISRVVNNVQSWLVEEEPALET